MSPGGASGRSHMTSPTSLRTHVVGSGPDAITYDVWGDLGAATPERPALLLFGSPMDAGGFATLAGSFADRPVVTLDPRGAGRNPTGVDDVTPEQHAEDLHRVVGALGVGAVDAFGTSGGAVNLLALLAAHPDDVRRAVAHEPPTAAYLPDREVVLAVIGAMKATYLSSGDGPAMAAFIALVMHQGELTADYLDRPAPDPAQLGLSAVDDGVRSNPLFRNMPSGIEHRVADAVRGLGHRLVIAVGAESGDELAARGGRSVADHLGLPVTVFPSHHGGFLAAGMGPPGDPEGFAAALRAVVG
ncbi:alpha/beta hydrolase [soil metagenome]